MRFTLALVLVLVMALVASLTACVTRTAPPPIPPTAADVADAKLPVRCGSRDQCDRWWRTAQVWVVKNAGYRVQIATDAIVQTAGPDSGSSSWFFLATRAPHADGGEAIELEARCGSAATCSPAYETAVADFKRAVRGTR
jgi:hypothetical protein